MVDPERPTTSPYPYHIGVGHTTSCFSYFVIETFSSMGNFYSPMLLEFELSSQFHCLYERETIILQKFPMSTILKGLRNFGNPFVLSFYTHTTSDTNKLRPWVPHCTNSGIEVLFYLLTSISPDYYRLQITIMT